MTITPGPWALEHDWQEQPGAIIILSADNQIVADAWAPRLERKANAHLIAAAPELLESLRECADHVKREIDTLVECQTHQGTGQIDPDDLAYIDAEREILARANAAIAKAGGR